MALCYCKLDYYDVSLEILQVYLDKYRDSSVVGASHPCSYRIHSGLFAERSRQPMRATYLVVLGSRQCTYALHMLRTVCLCGEPSGFGPLALHHGQRILHESWERGTPVC